MLILHELLLVTMPALKAAVHHNQTSLLQYPRCTPSLAASQEEDCTTNSGITQVIGGAYGH